MVSLSACPPSIGPGCKIGSPGCASFRFASTWLLERIKRAPVFRSRTTQPRVPAVILIVSQAHAARSGSLPVGAQVQGAQIADLDDVRSDSRKLLGNYGFCGKTSVRHLLANQNDHAQLVGHAILGHFVANSNTHHVGLGKDG